ncbi:NAD(P)-dependent oxidoreductase [soil metagenome]
MTKVLVLGTTGMLGSVVHEWLRTDKSLRVSGTARDVAQARELGAGADESLQALDAERGETPNLTDVEWVVNCVGVIKPFIRDDNRDEVARAIQVNAHFPMRLALAAEKTGTRVIQIATDCVYSGRDGCYDERAAFDATDVYGKSKSLGEVRSPNMMHLRCSIIGPEVKGFVSLLSWFLKQERGASLNGYRNHLWNGVTTLHFAKLACGIIKQPPAATHMQHVIPTGDITKANLLRSFAREFDRPDLTINEVDAPTVIDRRLRTAHAEANAALWRAAGYAEPPTVETMVREVGEYQRSRRR